MEDYLDAIVQGDTKAEEEYKRKCLEVKAKYPKDLILSNIPTGTEVTKQFGTLRVEKIKI